MNSAFIDDSPSCDAVVVHGCSLASPNIWGRLHKTLEECRRHRKAILILLGGSKGAQVPGHKEADWLELEARQGGLAHRTVVLKDWISWETGGNIVIALAAFLLPLGLRHVRFVTTYWHGPRTQLLWNHIGAGHVVADCAPAECFEDKEAQSRLIRKELKGVGFAFRLIDSTDPGDIAGAFDFLQKQHEDRPYSGKTLQALVDELSPQVDRVVDVKNTKVVRAFGLKVLGQIDQHVAKVPGRLLAWLERVRPPIYPSI